MFGSTIAWLAISLAVLGFANFMSRRPAAPGTVRYIPYHAIQFLALVVVLLMLAHLISLLTGQPFTGRLGGP